MSYLVLARKWRPKDFDSLVGQESIVKVLKNSIEQRKIAHAYLFSGPRGVGKTSTARVLAKSLNCENGPTPSPCGKCKFCISISDGFSMDVIEIDGASNNSVNDIRDLRERVIYVPSEGRYKIYIIDETHMLSDAAFNALLKTLEEPPPHVVFILATTAPKKIPLTVISRCQHLLFRRIPTIKIKERLKVIAAQEGIDITEQAIEMISRYSDGSLRDALTLLDQISSFSSNVNEEDIKDLLGITDIDLIIKVSRAIIRGDRKDIVVFCNEISEKGIDVRAFFKELIQFFRNMLVFSIMKDSQDVLDLSTEEISTLKEIIKEVTDDHISVILSELLRAELDIRNSQMPRIALEMALLKLSFLKEIRPLKDIINDIISISTGDEISKIEGVSDLNTKETLFDRNEVNEDILNDGIINVENKHTDLVLNDDNSAQEIVTEEVWQKCLKKIDLPLATKLSKAQYKVSKNSLILLLNGGDSIFADSIKRDSKLLEKVIYEETGLNLKVKIDIIKSKEFLKTNNDLRKEIISDPEIKKILELFDGRVVDVRPLINNNNNQ